MAAERLSMRQIREILRQKWTLGRSHRAVAQHLRAGLGTVSGVERRARAAGDFDGKERAVLATMTNIESLCEEPTIAEITIRCYAVEVKGRVAESELLRPKRQ